MSSLLERFTLLFDLSHIQSNCLSQLINETEPYDLLQINIDGIYSQTKRDIDQLKETIKTTNNKPEHSRVFSPSNSSLWQTFLNATFGNDVLTHLREESV